MRLNTKLKHLKTARMDTLGRAIMLEFEPVGGDIVTLEIERDMLPTMLKILYQFAKSAGEFAPPQQSLSDVPLHSALLLPAEEIEARTTEQGGVWLLTRTGALDTAVALPDPRAAQLLAESLLAARSK